MRIDKERIMKAVREILEAIGEDPEREGLKDTPRRVADMYEELLEGYNFEEKWTYFTERSDLIIVGPIEFHSLCEHHLLPFSGYVFIAYLPTGKVLGLSKLIYIVYKYAKRLQIQERLGEQIADELVKIIGNDDVMVVIKATHKCVEIRGAKNHCKMITSAVRGKFFKDLGLRLETLILALSREVKE